MAERKTSWVTAVFSHCPTFHWVPPSCLHCVRLKLHQVSFPVLCLAEKSDRLCPQWFSAPLCSQPWQQRGRAGAATAGSWQTDKVLLPSLGAANLWARLRLCWSCPGGAGMQGGAMGLAQFSCSPVYSAWSNKDVVSAPCVASCHVAKAVGVCSDIKTSKHFL